MNQHHDLYPPASAQTPPVLVGVASRTEAPSNGLATPGMVLGIIGLSISWIPLLNFFSLPLGILATVLGGIGFSKSNKLEGLKKGQAIAGIVCGVLAIAIWVLILAAFSAALSSGVSG